jgi:pyruvate dehydrogenase E2 component (dihydrolipoamide acetyltransferase)
MAEEIRFPRLGWSMEEGRFVGWLRKSGDTIREGDPLFEMEGEKAVQEIESVGSGILFIPPTAPEPDSVLGVGTVLGYLLGPGEVLEAGSPIASAGGAKTDGSNHDRSLSEQLLAGGLGLPEEELPRDDSDASEQGVAGTSSPGGPASPSVRRQARQLGVDIARVVGSGRSGRVTAADVARYSRSEVDAAIIEIESEDEESQIDDSIAAGSTMDGKTASPRARRAAKALGIDWRDVTGSGRSGRVREEDVLSAARVQSRKPKSPAAGKRFGPRRKAIADRLRASQRATVPVTLHTVADVTGLVAYREQQKVLQSSYVPAYTDLIAKLLAVVMDRHPAMAVRWNGDHTDLEEVPRDAFHIGIAVDTPDGLLVPVVRSVGSRSIEGVVEESRRLIARAREGRLTREEMSGGVITITNLGAYGIDGFTPIINLPEIAILGLGAIRREPVFREGDRVEARDRMVLSLTFDHAAIDGAPAAAFLKELVTTIEGMKL